MGAPTEENPPPQTLSPAARQVLATLYALETRDEEWPDGRPAAILRRHVRTHAARFWLGATLLPWDLAWTELAELEWLREEDGGGLELTPIGSPPAKACRDAFRRERFDEILVQAERSDAYARFLRQTGDLEVRAFSPLDRRQLDAVCDAVCASGPEPRLLDAGCGAGHVTEAVVRRCGGGALGVDYAPRAIELASARVTASGLEGVTFDERDLDALTPEDVGLFDVALAVDALVFVEDLEGVLRRLSACVKPGGRVVILALEASPRPEQAPTALALRGMALPFSQDDLSDLALPVLRARQFAAYGARRALRAEGNDLLASALVEESAQLRSLLDAGALRRYLYRAIKPE
ncbi:MAG: class I SAM-dependent methyltransferase [Acidobacteriota bacterium]